MMIVGISIRMNQKLIQKIHINEVRRWGHIMVTCMNNWVIIQVLKM